MISIPVWLGGALVAFLFSLLGGGIAWAWRVAGDMREVRVQLARLLEETSKYSLPAMNSAIETLRADVRELQAGHERNRQRIEEAYRDLAGTHPRSPT